MWGGGGGGRVAGSKTDFKWSQSSFLRIIHKTFVQSASRFPTCNSSVQHLRDTSLHSEIFDPSVLEVL